MIIVSHLAFLYKCHGIPIFPGSNVIDDGIKDKLLKHPDFAEKTKLLVKEGPDGGKPMIEIVEPVTPIVDEDMKAAVKASSVGGNQVLLEANAIMGMDIKHAQKALSNMLHTEVLKNVSVNDKRESIRTLAEKKFKEMTTLTDEELAVVNERKVR